MAPSPLAKAYFQFLQLSAAVRNLPGHEELDANLNALFEVVALHWSLGKPLSVRETIDHIALGSPATLHKRLHRLIALDFVKSEALKTDRRIKFVSPTTKGLKYAHSLGDKLMQSLQSTPK